MALRRSVSTPNSRPEHGRLSGSGSQIVGGMGQTSGLTRPVGKLCDSLYCQPRVAGKRAVLMGLDELTDHRILLKDERELVAGNRWSTAPTSAPPARGVDGLCGRHLPGAE